MSYLCSFHTDIQGFVAKHNVCLLQGCSLKKHNISSSLQPEVVQWVTFILFSCLTAKKTNAASWVFYFTAAGKRINPDNIALFSFLDCRAVA